MLKKGQVRFIAALFDLSHLTLHTTKNACETVFIKTLKTLWCFGL